MRTHFPALDGLRALAILLVIPHNADMLSGPLNPIEFVGGLVVHAGWIGVQLFFVLSGFLITGNLLDTRGSDNYFSSFFGRRALRILPLYFAVLLITFVLAPLLVQMPPDFRATQGNQVWLWTFLSNWTQPFDGSVSGFTHFWSLAVEEQFYLIWPFVVWRSKPESLLRFCGIVVLAAMIARETLIVLGYPADALYMFTICRMDALALGAGAAAALRIPALRDYLERCTRRIALAAIFVMVLAAVLTHTFSAHDVNDQTVGYTLIAFAFALLILLAVLPTRGMLATALKPLNSTLLRLVGRYSYGMYVFHLPLMVFFGAPAVHRLVAEVTPAVSFAYAFTMILLSFVLAALSYELFERHFLRLKSRFTYKDGTPTPARDPAT